MRKSHFYQLFKEKMSCYTHCRNSRPEVFLRKGVLKICSKFSREHPCRIVISVKLQRSFIEIALRHGCSPVHLLHIFRTPFPKSTPGRLFLTLLVWYVHAAEAVIRRCSAKKVFLRISQNSQASTCARVSF